jgi:anti-sigma28 factor (negative regulator of flagellin synthesis)
MAVLAPAWCAVWVVFGGNCRQPFRSGLPLSIEFLKAARKASVERLSILRVRELQLSSREIEKTLDFFRARQEMGPQGCARELSAEEIEGIRQIARKLSEVPPIRQDRVDKVRQAFESSSYDVPCDDVARELIGRVISDKLT